MSATRCRHCDNWTCDVALDQRSNYIFACVVLPPFANNGGRRVVAVMMKEHDQRCSVDATVARSGQSCWPDYVYIPSGCLRLGLGTTRARASRLAKNNLCEWKLFFTSTHTHRRRRRHIRRAAGRPLVARPPSSFSLWVQMSYQRQPADNGQLSGERMSLRRGWRG